MDGDLIETGEVVGVGPGSADVRVAATDACAGCSHCSRVDKDGMLITDARNDVGAVEGDSVEVVIPAGADLRAGFYAYLLPVAALLVGYGVGNTLGRAVGWDPDPTGAVFALAGVAGGMLYMRTRARKVLSSDRFRPRVRAIMAPANRPGAGSAARVEQEPAHARGRNT